MGLYSQFQTDTTLEREGIVLDYHFCRVRVSRAGGANTQFARVLAAKTKPHRRAIQTETIDRTLAERLEHEVYAEAVIQDWETKTGEDENGEPIYERGIEAPDGSLLPVTVENLVATFRNLPDLFEDIKEQSSKVALFRKETLEADAKN